MTIKTKKAKEKVFSITLTMGGVSTTGSGKTALEALTSLPRPLKITSKGEILITDGEKKNLVLMYPIRLKRLFFNKLFQEFQVKNLCMGMK